jgi:hypothetical protein
LAVKRLTDEELRRAEMNADTAKQFYARHGKLPGTAGLDVLDVVPALIAEIRDLRAVLATPVPRDWDEPFVTSSTEYGTVVVCEWLEQEVEPDEAIALGAALIRTAQQGKGE